MSSHRKRDNRSEAIEKADTAASHEGLERQIEASQIIQALKVHLPNILQGRPVLLAYAYGSVAQGCMTPFSDVDIALVLARGSALAAYQRFLMELEIGAEIEKRCGIRDADVRSIDHAPLRVQG